MIKYGLSILCMAAILYGFMFVAYVQISAHLCNNIEQFNKEDIEAMKLECSKPWYKNL